MRTCRIITEVFPFYSTCFNLPFLLITFFKRVPELLLVIAVHPRLIFCGALKKALIVTEDRSYQTQYFSKIFPGPLVLAVNIHLYLLLNESLYNVF